MIVAHAATQGAPGPAPIVPEGDRLPLPDQIEAKLLCPDIMVCKKVLPWAQDLIDLVNKIDRWKQSSQVSSHGGSGYTDEGRTSSSFFVTCKEPIWGPQIAPYELGTLNALHSCARAYMSYNPHCEITDDTGYEMLRYEKGQHFKEHIDTIVGRHEGFRQLTALVYLNEDYTGGQTTFRRQGVTIKPEAGDILLFPSNFVYPHASPPVIEGAKYVIVTWFVAYPKKA